MYSITSVYIFDLQSHKTDDLEKKNHIEALSRVHVHD